MKPSEDEINNVLRGLYENRPENVEAARKVLSRVVQSADHKLLFVLYEALHIIGDEAQQKLDYVTRNN